jgi:hypothetical protein
MKQCPNCNAKITSSIGCYRCGLEFQKIIQCQQQSIKYYIQALRKYYGGELEIASSILKKAQQYSQQKNVNKLQRLIQLKKLYDE